MAGRAASLLTLATWAALTSPHGAMAGEQLPATRDELRASLAAIPELAPEMVERLTAQALPGIQLVATPKGDDAIRIGASKFGGGADLPESMAWPVRPPYPDAEARRQIMRQSIGLTLARAGIAPDWMPAEEGKRFVAERQKAEREAMDGALKGLDPDVADQLARAMFGEDSALTPEQARDAVKDDEILSQLVFEPAPLALAAQIDLAEMARQPGFDPDLPDTGRLLFFYDLAVALSATPPDRSGWKLIWDQTPVTQLKRQQSPTALAGTGLSWKAELTPSTIEPISIFTPIAQSDVEWDAIKLIGDPSETYPNGPYWAYQEWLAVFDPRHQLGGRALPLQNGLQARAQLGFHGLPVDRPEDYKTPQAAEALQGAGDWKLVLQFGADEAIGLPAGAHYVLMRKDDLKARRFENAWVISQSD